MNPVLKRELLVRWRGHAVWLMLVAITLLALVVWITYSGEVTRQQWNNNSVSQMSRIGRRLFEHLAYLQVIGWVLLAPALTSTSISGERERGLLDALRLSHLSAARIVWGKLGGAMFFVLQIALGVLPLIAICFLMGGVAPAEFVLAAWLQLVTAFCGLCIGLYFSAINRRSSGAIIATMVFSLAWFFLSLFAAIAGGMGSRGGHWATPIYKPLGLVGVLNPFVLALSTLQDNGGFATSPFTFAPGWMIGTAPQLSLAALLLWGAIRAVRRPLDSQVLAELEKPRRRFFFRRRNKAENAREYSHLKTARAHWNLLPSSWTRGLNPLLRRELHARLRVPLPRGVWRWWAALGIVALFDCFVLLWRNVWIGAAYAKDIQVLAFIFGTIGLALAATVIGALSLARERENSTWEMLRLSLLSPGEVLRAKFLPIVLACGVYSLALWPLLLLGAWPRNAWPKLRAWIFGLAPPSTLWPPASLDAKALVLSVGVAAAVVVVCAAWGLCVSWRVPKVATAVAWAVGGVFLLFGVAPFLGIILIQPSRLEDWLVPWHPLMIFNELTFNGTYRQSIAADNAMSCCALWLGVSAFLLFFLYRALQRDLRPLQRRAASTCASEELIS